MNKLYYSINEIADIVDEEQHIIRYWEKEFEHLKPRKNRAGNRVFSERDLYVTKLIKKLLREDKLSIKGANEQLDKILLSNNFSDIAQAENQIPLQNNLNIIKKTKKIKTTDKHIINNELHDIKNILEQTLQFLKAL